MSNYTLFISDLHLQEFATNKIASFAKLLTQQAKNAAALYILGDLFQAWIGDDDNSAFSVQIRALLKKFTLNGPPVYIMHGNHDFLLADKFCLTTGCNLVKDPTIIDLYGAPTLICHGDTLCANDKLHQLFRKYIYNPKYCKLFLQLPLIWRKGIAKFMVKQSVKRHNKHGLNREAISQQLVVSLMARYKIKQLIHGHTHIANTFEPAAKKSTGRRITLGAWDNSGYNILLYYSDHTIHQTTAS